MKRRILLGLIILFILSMGVFPATVEGTLPVGLVVRSPLFGTDVAQTTMGAVPFGTYAEQLGLPEKTPIAANNDTLLAQRLLMAVSDSTYPVTPGDALRLIYADGVNRISVDLQVDSMYQLDIPSMGTIDAKNMTLPQLKERIFSVVSTYYAYANPQLTLIRTGSFLVTVTGEVSSTGSFEAWALARLSSVVGSATNYASTRDVVVKSLDGTEKHYDLYKALKCAQLSEDPLLKAGDVVVIGKAGRIVTLSGAVFRPGTYQLMDNEGLKDLVTTYGGGLLPQADIQHVRVQHFDVASATLQADYIDLLSHDSTLGRYDQVVVDTVSESGKSIILEGAVRSDEAYDPTTSTAIVGQVSGRIFYQYYPGETLQQMLKVIQGRLMTSSDLEHAYLVRGGQKTIINLKNIISGSNTGEPMVLQADDQLTIPFAQRFVTVSGGVVRSGTYAFVPDKTADYYLALAGGPSTDAYKPLSVSITDENGKKVDRSATIGQEYTITVKVNTFVKDLAPAVAIIGLVSTAISILYYSVITINNLK